MHKGTLFWMLLAVLTLGGFAAWQLGRERGQAPAGERPLFEGLDTARIRALRVDNLERGLQLRIELDAEGRWRIVDPIEYPAERSVIELLFDILSTSRARPVEGQPDLARLQLSPPRVVLEFEEQRSDGGTPVRRRIEVGARDLDGQSVHVRIDGQVLRTLLAIDSTLERDLPEWRARSVFDLSPFELVEVHRSGSVEFEPGGPALDLGLDIVNDGGWRMTAPWNARLDPGAVGILLTNLALLRTTGFLDQATEGLAPYGLDPAPVTISFSTVSGAEERLRLAPSTGGVEWPAARDGAPYVYSIEQGAGMVLLTPPDVLVDREVLRAVRDRVESLRLVKGERQVRLHRSGKQWLVSAQEAGVTLVDSQPADPGRVQDLLGTIERSRVLELLPEVDFPAGSEGDGIFVDLDDGVRGGELGPERTVEGGGTGALFRRLGDGLVTLVDRELLELLEATPESLRSRELMRLRELDVARADLTLADEERSYVRSDRGRWSLEGSQAEARDFLTVVDRLLSLKAERFLGAGEELELRDPVAVRLHELRGPIHVFRIGAARLPDGREVAVYQGDRDRALVPSEFHRDLLALFGR